jgi:broad specificity phosphatase PhoE
MWAAVSNEEAWPTIVSSPLRRCSEFARALAQQIGAQLIIDERWRELNFGAWEGKSAASLWHEQQRALLDFWADPVRYPPPLSEPLPQLRGRVVAAWRDWRTLAQEQRLLVVSHGGPLRVLLGAVQNIPLRKVGCVAVPLASLHRVDARFDFVDGDS